MHLLPSAEAKCRTYNIKPTDLVNYVADMVRDNRVPYNERIAFYFEQTIFVVVRSPFDSPVIS